MEGAQLHAYGQIAQAISWHMLSKAECDDVWMRASPRLGDAPWPIYFDDHMSTFEAAAQDLVQLGILKGAKENERWHCAFVFDCDPADAYNAAKKLEIRPSV